MLGWAAFGEPYVEVTDGGVTVANTLRTIEVPWPAIDEVEGRYGLKLLTAYGPVTAWAASAPAGRQRAHASRRESSASRLSSRGSRELRRGRPPGRSAGWSAPRLTTTWDKTLVAAVTVAGRSPRIVLPFAA